MLRLYSPSIRLRLTLWYGAILAVTFCAVALLILLALGHSVQVTVDKDLRARFIAVRSYVEQEASKQGQSALKEELNEDAVASGGPAYLRIAGN
ncbi:MAG: hypothetical protein JO051_08825, partial [Acidobacteriaceae bacterium]|nr:hypothetical protein [Acidobacteriaceae bacterium]